MVIIDIDPALVKLRIYRRPSNVAVVQLLIHEVDGNVSIFLESDASVFR